MSDVKPTLLGNWHFPTEVRFGSGRIAELADACKELEIKQPMLVTDPGLAQNPLVTDTIRALRDANLKVVVFSDIKPNPVGINIEQGTTVYKAGEHDGIIAFGGGSALDAGKTIALMADQERPLWDFEDVGENYKRVKTNGIAPCIAIPTTAGTGAEVGRASVIIDSASNTKKIIFHPQMIPNLVIADPELTLGLPAELTAATGIDALTHCLEAYSVSSYHPYADGIAMQGMKLIKNWLPVAYQEGNNLTARCHMLAASGMGATAFQKGLGATHALAHPLGAMYDKHHGLLNAIILPYVLIENRCALDKKMLTLAQFLQIAKPSFDAVLEWLLELRAQLNIPHQLSEIDIDTAQTDEVIEHAMLDAALGTNPIDFTKDQMAAIFENAVAGKIHT